MAVVVLALVGAVALGLLVGGRFAALGALPLRQGWLVVGAVAAQVVGALTPLRAAYAGGLVLSALLVGAFLLRNRRLPGSGLIAIGLTANAVAVLANHHVMPVDLQALARVGGDSGALLHDPRHAPASAGTRLRPLTGSGPSATRTSHTSGRRSRSDPAPRICPMSKSRSDAPQAEPGPSEASTEPAEPAEPADRAARRRLAPEVQWTPSAIRASDSSQQPLGRCWDSCWDAILNAYRQRREITCTTIDLAVRLEGFEPPTFLIIAWRKRRDLVRAGCRC